MLNKNKVMKTVLASVVGLATPVLMTSGKIARAQEWSYGGYTNPTEWGELSSKYRTCETGNKQSPINIREFDTSRGGRGNVQFNYDPSDLEVINNGATVKVNYDSGSSVTIDGKTYKLKQFHFHTPSEHRINDELSAMELHLVHKSNDGDYAVVGVMIEPGKTNSEMAKVWSNIPDRGNTKKLNRQVSAANFLPQEKDYYKYSGSFTTPPCTQGVTWIMFDQPIKASKQQIDAFSSLYPANNRPIQEVNNRQIMEMRQ